MTDTALVSNAKISSADTVEPLYTSPSGGKGTIITAFTATNCIGTGVSYKAYIVTSSGSADCAIIPFTIVGKDRFHSGPSIVNQVVPAGSSIQAENSTSDGLAFTISGREQWRIFTG